MNFLNPKQIISQAVISPNSTVVDFGFGKGEFLKFLARETGEQGKVYAIDIQADIVKRVSQEFKEEKIDNVEFLQADLEQVRATQLADKSVDFILISALFFQLHNKKAVAREAVRILKNNGRILFIDWQDSFKGIGPDQDLIFNEDQAIVFWRDYPLEMERRLESGKYHYALIYRKK